MKRKGKKDSTPYYRKTFAYFVSKDKYEEEIERIKGYDHIELRMIEWDSVEDGYVFHIGPNTKRGKRKR